MQELIDASAFDINRMPGVGVVVRSELQRRRRHWATKFASTTSMIDDAADLLLRGVESTQAALVPERQVQGRRAPPAWPGGCSTWTSHEAAPTWPDHATAAADAGVADGPHRGLAALAAHWAKSPIVADLRGEVTDTLAVLGGVATVDELAERLVALRGSTAEGATRRRNAVGLVRAVVEADAGRAAGPRPPRRPGAAHHHRRAPPTSDSRPPSPWPTPPTRPWPPPPPAGPPDRWARTWASTWSAPTRAPATSGIGDPQRALALAARASATAAVSSRSELYPRGMSAAAAVAAVLGATQSRITPDRLRALAGSRFPAALPAPDRPDLDPLVTAAAPALTWDPEARAYARADSGSGSLLSTGTIYTPGVPVLLRRGRRGAGAPA